MEIEKNPTPAEIVVMAGAGAAFLFSFFPFYSGRGGVGNISAWGSGLFPVATLIVLFAVAAGVLVALVRFANVQYPKTTVAKAEPSLPPMLTGSTVSSSGEPPAN